jgi:hypothetical protein
MLQNPGCRPQISYILQYFSGAHFTKKTVNILSVQEFMDLFHIQSDIILSFQGFMQGLSTGTNDLSNVSV